VKIGIIGLGKLGLPLAVLFSKHFKVYGVDISERRINQIMNCERFHEPQVNEYLEEYGSNLKVSTDYKILKSCSVVFIIAQTPSLPSGKFDLQYVKSALKQLHKVNPECLAVISSTINIDAMQKLRKIHKKICYNPEFIRQGSIMHDFKNPRFVLIGAYNQKDGETVEKIWRTVHNKPIHIVEPVEAEITKLSLNVSFTLGITFANVIGEVCEVFGANPSKILNLIYLDRRDYQHGLGFGGPCFPRDVKCFERICQEKSVLSGSKFAGLINMLNNYTLDRYHHKILEAGKKKIAILGVSYKPDVALIVESQPLKIAEKLMREGYKLHVYDPLTEDEAAKVLNEPNVKFHPTTGKCLEHAEAVFIGMPLNIPKHLLKGKTVINPWDARATKREQGTMDKYIAILEALFYSGPQEPTQISHRTNINPNALEKYIDFLIRQQLIKEYIGDNRGDAYVITQSGKAVLRKFRKLETVPSIMERTESMWALTK